MIIYSLSQFWWIALLSIVFILGIVFIVPLLIVKLPADYFSQKGNRSSLFKILFPFNYMFLFIKNGIGLLLICFGIILLFIPGQGLLTIFTGLMLLNFPGKRRLELYLIRKKAVLNVINWLRSKYGKDSIVNIYDREN